jgi:hypothetical protein
MIGSQRARIKKTLTPLRHRSPTLRGLSTHCGAITAAVKRNRRSRASAMQTGRLAGLLVTFNWCAFMVAG